MNPRATLAGGSGISGALGSLAGRRLRRTISLAASERGAPGIFGGSWGLGVEMCNNIGTTPVPVVSILRASLLAIEKIGEDM